MTTVLVDGDIVAFSCAAYNDQYEWEATRRDIDSLMQRIIDTTAADSYKVFLTGSNNFRYKIDPEYKANRKGAPQPRYRQDANAYLVTEWSAQVRDGDEADDAMSIEQYCGTDTIIASIDKDLKQVPGNHYNWRKDEFDSVSIIDGLRSFYRGLLIGDNADNIRGVRGIGPVKASRIIDDLEDEVDMFLAVQTLYFDDARLLRNGRLMHLKRYEDDLWEFPHNTTIQSEGEAIPIQE